jgi:RNA polymerase sigma-70 factor (ECF subfamily)
LRPTRAGRSADSDAQLVAQARDGDEAAFEAIVERYRPLLLNHCRRITGETAAHDAVQQALLSAWRDLRRGTDVQDLRPWLVKIAHNAALTTLRDRNARHAELPESLAGGRSTDETVVAADNARAALRAVADLPSLERDALLATAVQGRSGRATASSLGVSEAQLRQLVFRARTKVRAAGVYALVPPLFVWRWLVHGRARTGIPPAGASPAWGIAARLGAVALTAAAISTPAVVLTSGSQHPDRATANGTSISGARKVAASASGVAAHLPQSGRHGPANVSGLPVVSATTLTSLPATVANTTITTLANSLGSPLEPASRVRHKLTRITSAARQRLSHLTPVVLPPMTQKLPGAAPPPAVPTSGG